MLPGETSMQNQPEPSIHPLPCSASHYQHPTKQLANQMAATHPYLSPLKTLSFCHLVITILQHPVPCGTKPPSSSFYHFWKNQMNESLNKATWPHCVLHTISFILYQQYSTGPHSPGLPNQSHSTYTCLAYLLQQRQPWHTCQLQPTTAWLTYLTKLHYGLCTVLLAAPVQPWPPPNFLCCQLWYQPDPHHFRHAAVFRPGHFWPANHNMSGHLWPKTTQPHTHISTYSSCSYQPQLVSQYHTSYMTNVVLPNPSTADKIYYDHPNNTAICYSVSLCLLGLTWGMW